MKIKFLIFSFLLIAFGANAQVAVNDSENSVISISNHLRSSGRVAIYQDSRLESLISTQPKSYYANAARATKSDAIIASGYRIRVFSGSNQVVSKKRAYEIEKDLKAYNQDIDTYVIFKSPNWRLVVGNYSTNEEAISALRELKKAFPEYGKEMFVIKDQIEIKRDE